MDTTEIRVYGHQEHSAYNGHFESTCYHPLLLFNGEGDSLAARLRPGNVASADGWEELLLPEIDRQQAQDREVVSRGDAAFARPEVYDAHEARQAKYAIRFPANPNLEHKNHGIAEAARGQTEPQAGGPVQELLLSSGQLDQGGARGGEGRIPHWGVVPAGRLHRDQP
jgi:Transposase DDE domain group 1